MTRLEHIEYIKRAIAKGEREIDSLFYGKDIGDAVAIQEYSIEYHNMRHKQEARIAMLERLLKKEAV